MWGDEDLVAVDGFREGPFRCGEGKTAGPFGVEGG